MTALTVPDDIDPSLARRHSLSALLDAAKRHLDEARSYEQLRKVRAEARALETFAKAVGAGREAQRRCAEYVLRADQRLGQELRKAEKAKGGGGRHGRKRSRDATASPASAKLSDLGITKSQSSRVHALAAVPEKVFEEYIATAPEISLGGALKLTEVKRTRRAAKERELAAKTKAAASKLGAKLYGVIYADPPWRFEPYSRDTGMDRAADNHYPTLTVSEIAALKVPTARDCVLFLWATAPMLPEALNVLGSWGFAYKTHFSGRRTRSARLLVPQPARVASHRHEGRCSRASARATICVPVICSGRQAQREATALRRDDRGDVPDRASPRNVCTRRTRRMG